MNNEHERKLDKELRFHIAQLVDDYIAAGMTREDAERRARLEFGGMEQVKEECRESRVLFFIDTLLRDIRYGLRMLRRNPGFTAVAVLSIALGIGANTAIFSIIQALLLRWLPVPNPQQLMLAKITINGNTSDSFSYPVVQALTSRKDIFAHAGGFCGNSFLVGPPDSLTRTSGSWVSGEFFETLGFQPAAGRLLIPEDDAPGAPLAAVISDGYWSRIFSRNPRAVGSVLLVEGHPVTIVGVTPSGYTGANVGDTTDVTMPFQAAPQLFPDRQGLLGAGNQYIRILARPAASLSAEQVRARLKVVWPAIATVSVNPNTPAKRRAALLSSTLDVVPGGTGWTTLRNQYTKPLYILLSISGLVLLVACANVANLLLARSTARRREIAVRLAIGAGRGRIVRQLLVESSLLSVMGAGLGLIVAQFGSQLLLRLVSGGPRPIPLEVGINLPVLAFAAAVAIVTGMLFGLAPAFRATGDGPGAALKSNKVSGSHGRLAPSLVAAQVTLSLLLLTGAGLFIRTLRNLQAIDPGFKHEGVLMLDVDTRRVMKEPGPQVAFFQEGLSTIASLKGVSAVSVSNYTPISGGFWSQNVLINGHATTDEDHPFFAISPGYFDTLGMRMIQGRDFTPRDTAGSPPVVIVNEELVRRLIPDGHALGQHVSTDSRYWQNMEIVGVVSNSISYTLRQGPRPAVYVPFFQVSPDRFGFGTFEIKVAGSLTATAALIEQTMQQRLPGGPLKARPFTAQVEASIRREILMAQLAGFFGLLALVLAGVGLYGLLAYMVTQRTSEIGIRMALGAQDRQVLWMILRNALRLVSVGVAVGLPIAWWASRWVSGMLYGLSPTDPVTIVGATAMLATTALLAGLLPARRASRVDPMVALRYE